MFNHSLRAYLAELAPRPTGSRGELAAESISVKIRWFGLVVGILLINFESQVQDRFPLYLILALGFFFTAVDTAFFYCGRIFLREYPLLISALESLFIGLLCLFDSGSDSSFRFYYLLSLTCCAIRYAPRTAFITCGMDLLSYAFVYLSQPASEQILSRFLITFVILVWITWAVGAMARLLKQAGEELHELNAALRENQTQLETRIHERTRELQESQAQVLHQEKMAAFGLLAAGIAHEVGNPLTSISSVVQMLERRDMDEYTREKLGLVNGQLARIQSILRELITFSRPADDRVGRVSVQEVIEESLAIAKFYKGGKYRQILAEVPEQLPTLLGARDQFIQVVFNLVLNAIDATGKGGRIVVSAELQGQNVVISVVDNGAGIEPEHLTRLFRPYFTTKRHGTGLGLFVVRRITEQHGGTVSVTSQLGVGTTFQVSLPSSSECKRSEPGIRNDLNPLDRKGAQITGTTVSASH